ncbi:DJ-1/PfpI family protein [Luteimonas sp. RD2P54]|uniref:DJ-1/PfpI family protein n=1 Tax=Luteimonas endophytica TaxID=3042023 RepID=A0ABT6JE59_9GAMM|nr:DJ-1/PfpI family protein [Luteimonas endophytica]MDH5824498.1 DJ-1/PfpI family protein [Luteimonas endophytica]
MKRNVAILVFEDAEVLDFAGPFEVFAVSSQLNAGRGFDVGLVAEHRSPVRAMNGMTVVANWTWEDMPAPDVLVVVGGRGSRQAMAHAPLRAWVAQAAAAAEVVLSVCGGARIVGALGLLDGRQATTHRQAFDELQAIAPAALLRRDARVVDAGRIVTTGGISAGIDGALHVVSRLLGEPVAQRTAAYMEYAWDPACAVVAPVQ